MMNPSISLRPIGPADFGAIAAVIMRAFLPHEPRFSLPSVHFLRMAAEDCPQASWVVEQAGRMVGVVFGHTVGRTGWLGPLAVSPNLQNKGMGKILCGACLHGLRQSGCTVVGLDSRAEPALVQFYQRSGFIMRAETVDGLKELSSASELEGDLFCYSHGDRFSFKSKWFALQQEVAPGFDYWPTLERLHRFGYGDALLLSRRHQVVAGMILQNGPRGADDISAVVRLQVWLSSAAMGVEQWAGSMEAAVHSRFPDSTHVFVRLRAFSASALAQMGYRLLRSGYRCCSELFSSPAGVHEWIWE